MPDIASSAARTFVRVFLLGAWVNPINQRQAIDEILSWCAERKRRFVVTPNVDHCRMLQKNPALRAAYDKASLTLADGWPLVAASYVTQYPLKARVTGSDIILPLCEACAARGFSVFLLGTTDEVLKTAAEVLRARMPGLTIAGSYSPPFGFERDAAEVARIDEIISRAEPHIVFAAFGSPKQEVWMAGHVSSLPVGAAIGVGAGLDFIARYQTRAPLVLRWLGLEWFWRAATEPRRLLKRYALCFIALPGLIALHVKQHFLRKAGVQPWEGR